MDKIKIAQIGTSENSHGNNIVQTLLEQSDDYEFAGVAFPENEEEVCPDKVGFFDGLPRLTVDEILNDASITAVAVETEEKYLTKYAISAAKANKHIHLEKPGGTDAFEYYALIGEMEKSKKVFHTGYMYRYNEVISNLFRRIENGELGEIISVEAQMNCIHTKATRKWLSEYEGGMMYFLGCHLADLVYRIMGEPKNIVPFIRKSGKDGILCDDHCAAVWDYGNATSEIKVCSVEIGGYARRQLTVIGTNGTVEINPLECYYKGGPLLYTEVTERFEKDWNDRGKKTVSEPFDRYDAMMRDFAERIRGKEEKIYTLDYEKRLYGLIQKSMGR